VSCHQFLHGLTPASRQWSTLASHYGEAVLTRYQRNIEHYLQVPSLTRVAYRLRPAWIGEYIASPYDLRPMLHETMVRTHLSDRDVRAIVRYFAAVAEVADPYAAPAPAPPAPRPDPQRVEQGRRLFATRGCAACHTLGNAPTGTTAGDLARSGPGAAMAPNLRFTRDRMHPEVLAEWLLDPQSFLPGTMMPALGLTRSEAELLRDFILGADPALQPPPAPPALAPPAPAARPVTWEEVKEEVLGQVCVPCHMNDHERDPGPGNQGGFGWGGSRLSMRTYETLVAGAGLPSMTDAQIALLEGWIAQGCPGPTRATGMPGIRDGYLVPDGPIARNRGCELRLPAGALATTAFALLALRALLATRAPFVPFALYVAIETACGVLLIQVWSTVSAAVDARSARRLLPIASVGAALAWLLGGLLVPSLVRAVGAPALLVAAPVLLGAAWALVRAVEARDIDPRAMQGRRASGLLQGWREGFGFVARTPLMPARSWRGW
jgi:mono/diheme cytochrome c family protein